MMYWRNFVLSCTSLLVPSAPEGQQGDLYIFFILSMNLSIFLSVCQLNVCVCHIIPLKLLNGLESTTAYRQQLLCTWCTLFHLAHSASTYRLTDISETRVLLISLHGIAYSDDMCGCNERSRSYWQQLHRTCCLVAGRGYDNTFKSLYSNPQLCVVYSICNLAITCVISHIQTICHVPYTIVNNRWIVPYKCFIKKIFIYKLLLLYYMKLKSQRAIIHCISFNLSMYLPQPVEQTWLCTKWSLESEQAVHQTVILSSSWLFCLTVTLQACLPVSLPPGSTIWTIALIRVCF